MQLEDEGIRELRIGEARGVEVVRIRDSQYVDVPKNLHQVPLTFPPDIGHFHV